MARKKSEAVQALEAMKAQTQHTPCAYDGCELAARMRVQTETGPQNVCDTHYDEHFRREAEKGCQALGLVRKPGESAENYRLRVSAWIKDRAARIAAKMRMDEEAP
jgi:hypothetical protein